MEDTPIVVWVVVAVGSAAGGLLRHLLSSVIGQSAAAILPWGLLLPWGTVVVNLLGSLAIGACAGLSTPAWTPVMRHALMTGVLGGFTTFSSFSLQTMTLIQQGEHVAAFANVTASVVLGLLACFGGYSLAMAWSR